MITNICKAKLSKTFLLIQELCDFFALLSQLYWIEENRIPSPQDFDKVAPFIRVSFNNHTI